MYYLKCLFPPYNTCQVTEIAEKVFLVARNKITERRTDSEDRFAVLLDEPSSAYPRGGSPITIGATISFCFFFVLLYRDNGKWKNFKSQTWLPVLRFFWQRLQLPGLIFDTSANVKISNFCKLFISVEVSNINPRNWSLIKKNGELAIMFVI